MFDVCIRIRIINFKLTISVERRRDQEVHDNENNHGGDPEKQVQRVRHDAQQHRSGVGRARLHRKVSVLDAIHLVGHQG